MRIPCPECQAELTEAAGGGVVEHYCARCGFAVRQSELRRSPRREGSFRVAFTRMRLDVTAGLPRWLLHPVVLVPGAIALALLALALQTLIAGSRAWEAVLFSHLYVQLFWLCALAIPSFVVASRHFSGSRLVLLGLAALVVGYWAIALTPGGAGDYCAARRFRIPPEVFRCAIGPAWYGGMLVGWWAAYGVMRRWFPEEFTAP